MTKTAVVDYGLGNLGSVVAAIRFLGHELFVASDAETIASYDSLILPGVGSYTLAMNEIRSRGLGEAITQAVTAGKSRILGICLGMQLLADFGEEGGGSPGLGLVPGVVAKFERSEKDRSDLHIGFAGVTVESEGKLMKSLPSTTDFYFVHEYRLSLKDFDSSWRIGVSDFGERFVSLVERENVMGVQFHPEKSQTNGLRVLANFLE